jgi:hypothetical protein
MYFGDCRADFSRLSADFFQSDEIAELKIFQGDEKMFQGVLLVVGKLYQKLFYLIQIFRLKFFNFD